MSRRAMSSMWNPDTPIQTIKWLLVITLCSAITIIFIGWAYTRVFYPQDYCSTWEVNRTLQLSEQIYDEYIHKRERIVDSRPQQIDPWGMSIYPYDYFVASFGCPFSLQRLGKLGGGGGSWICGIERYSSSKKPCVLYSFGDLGEASFEFELLRKSNCKLFAFDPYVKEPEKVVPSDLQDRVSFSSMNLGDSNTGSTMTLKIIMGLPEHTHIDILKLDIGGNELAILKQLITEFGKRLPVTQLIVKFHPVINDGADFARLYNVFIRMENIGLRPFRNEIDISQMVSSRNRSRIVSEYSFINTKKLC